MCFSRRASSVEKFFVGELLDLGDLLGKHLDADDEVAEELAFVGVNEGVVETHLADFAQVVQEDAGQQDVEIDRRVQIANSLAVSSMLTMCSISPPR